jgi:hypothetical protein
MNYEDAAFEFFGWDDDIGRQAPQMVEVRMGRQQRYAHRGGAPVDRHHTGELEGRFRLAVGPS